MCDVIENNINCGVVTLMGSLVSMATSHPRLLNNATVICNCAKLLFLAGTVGEVLKLVEVLVISDVIVERVNVIVERVSDVIVERISRGVSDIIVERLVTL